MSAIEEAADYMRVTVNAVTTLDEEFVRVIAEKIAKELASSLIMCGDRNAVVSFTLQRGVDPVKSTHIVPLYSVES